MHHVRNYSGPMQQQDDNAYFTELTAAKFFLYAFAVFYVIAIAILSILEPFLKVPCDEDATMEKVYENPDFDSNPCRRERFMILLWITREEHRFARSLVMSVLLGGIIGWERRQADRPAGIRTMSLVSLGSCLFTINSAYAFLDGPMAWDASRVAAAIPSGVGFLGAGLIFKKQETGPDGENTQIVHGLTTAASLWLSAGVGIACGGQLYFAASFGTAIMMIILRFGPRGQDENWQDDEDKDEHEEDVYEDGTKSYDSFKKDGTQTDSERRRLNRQASKASQKTSLRSRASLASIV